MLPYREKMFLTCEKYDKIMNMRVLLFQFYFKVFFILLKYFFIAEIDNAIQCSFEKFIFNLTISSSRYRLTINKFI